MAEREITRKDISNCIMHGEIIEDYPLDQDNILLRLPIHLA